MSKFTFINSLWISVIISGACLVYGLQKFWLNWPYSEVGHEYLLMAFVIACISLFFSLRLSYNGIAVLSLIIIFCSLFYAEEKFNWRKTYIEAANTDNAFPLERYIDSYPTFEDHQFAWLLDKPRWVEFANDCYTPMLRNRETGRNCKSDRLIQDYYGIDVRNIIRDYYGRMQNTARGIEKEKFRNKGQLISCIEQKKCAKIPLLPQGAEVDQQTNEYLDIRRQFWSIIEDDKISEENCNYFEFCRVMLEENIVQLHRL